MNKLFFALACVGLLSGQAAAATPEEDVQRFVEIFNGPVEKHQEAVQALAWMGLSDPRIFDPLEQRVLKEGPTARGIQRAERNRVAHYIRALGFSGQPKYLATIVKFRHDNEYDRFARVASEELPQYEKWNPIISNRATFNPKYGDDANRVRNMLLSDDLVLKRLAAKRIFFANREEELVERLAAALKDNYRRGPDDAEITNTIGWLIKGVACTKDAKYIPLLEEVAANAPNKAVRRHAKDAAIEITRPAGSR
jgi:hypothetical protein